VAFRLVLLRWFFGEVGALKSDWLKLANHVQASWFSVEAKGKWSVSGRRSDGSAFVHDAHEGSTWKHAAEFRTFPWPSEIEALEIETGALGADDGPGPLGVQWLKEVAVWAALLKGRYQSADGKVTGGWSRAVRHWAARLGHLPPRERKELLARIRWGEELPFTSLPERATKLRDNHKDLHLKPEAVWATLKEQLAEGAVLGFNTKNGTRVPHGVSPIRWVQKAGSDRVRITINLTKPNERFDEADTSVELETLQSQRHKFGLPWMCGFDQHSSYYQHIYAVGARKWMGFSVHDRELPRAARRTCGAYARRLDTDSAGFLFTRVWLWGVARPANNSVSPWGRSCSIGHDASWGMVSGQRTYGIQRFT
jgi:hypothetical protein